MSRRPGQGTGQDFVNPWIGSRRTFRPSYGTGRLTSSRCSSGGQAFGLLVRSSKGDRPLGGGESAPNGVRRLEHEAFLRIDIRPPNIRRFFETKRVALLQSCRPTMLLTRLGESAATILTTGNKRSQVPPQNSQHRSKEGLIPI